MMLFVALFGGMLIFMLLRVAMPLGVHIPGEPIGQVSLSLGERVRLQRTNVYAIGAVLLLTTLSGELPLVLELLVVLGVSAILCIPASYRLTSEGIALNHTVFRAWEELESFSLTSGGLVLHARPGLRPFRLVLALPKQHTVAAAVQRYLPERADSLGTSVDAASTRSARPSRGHRPSRAARSAAR